MDLCILKLIEYMRPPKILSYEMSLILQSHGLSKPTDRALYFDYIVNQLEPIERDEKESATLNKEEVTSVSLDEIVTEEEAGPEVDIMLGCFDILGFRCSTSGYSISAT